MIYQAMTEITPLLRGNQLPESHFYLLGVLAVVYQTHAVCKADTVGICHDSGLSEYVAHDQIGAFPAYARKL